MSARGSIGFLLHPHETHMVGEALQRAAGAGFRTWTVVSDPDAAMEEHRDSTQLLVTIGGDGTFLYGARLAAPLGIPVLGVNRGRLGFLTDVELAALPAALECFAAGGCRIQRRACLAVEVSSSGEGTVNHHTLAVNDVAVKSRGVSVARIRVEADGELLGDFDADGMVVATATGSTAYALSAGGPPVDPSVPALVVVPLAPHAVISRAVIVPEGTVLTITVKRGRVVAAADGHLELPLRDGARLTMRPGPDLQVIRVPGSPSFLQRLREKVRFGTPLKSMDHGGWSSSLDVPDPIEEFSD